VITKTSIKMLVFYSENVKNLYVLFRCAESEREPLTQQHAAKQAEMLNPALF
jgi:hypothetical protein